MAVQFDGGVIVGADSRTTTGSYIVRFTISRPIYLSAIQRAETSTGEPRNGQTDLRP